MPVASSARGDASHQTVAYIVVGLLSVLVSFFAFGASRQSKEVAPGVSVPAHKIPIGFNWEIITMTGWGNFGENLLANLWHGEHTYYPIVLKTQRQYDQVPILRQMWLSQSHLPTHFQSGYGYGEQVVPFPVMHSISGAFEKDIRLQAGVWGLKNVALCFFETPNKLNAKTIGHAKKYDLILAGSDFNTQALKAKGVNHVATAWQGVDTQLFKPSSSSERSSAAQAFEGKFVVFSGGKLEMRKGQDIVIAAFQRFAGKHKDAILVTAWHNQWPKLTQTIASMGVVQGIPEVRGDDVLLAPWLARNGIKAEQLHVLGKTRPHEIATILQRADAAIFTNRAEGGTNLVAMEAMSVGVPVIISNNTGHMDIIDPAHCYPLHNTPVAEVMPSWKEHVIGWGESDPEEAYHKLEEIYNDRDKAKEKGLRASKFIRQHFTWEASIARIARLMKEANIR